MFNKLHTFLCISFVLGACAVTAPEPTATPNPTSTPVPSPTAGEIDIMEFIGREPDHIYGTVHAPGYSDGNGVGSSMATSAESLKNDFHVYAIEQEENEIRWYFDDQ